MAPLYNEQQLRNLIRTSIEQIIPTLVLTKRRTLETRLMSELGSFIHSAIIDRPPSSGYYDD